MLSSTRRFCMRQLATDSEKENHIWSLPESRIRARDFITKIERHVFPINNNKMPLMQC
jgi:hypothetical protein